MKKLVLSVVIIGASALYLFMRSPAAAVAVQAPVQAAATTGTTQAPPASAPPQQAAGATPPPTTPSSATGAHMTTMMSPYKDGTFTGPSVDAYYGYVQVQATISGGKITNIAFLSYPNDRDTSRYINSQAMPMLQQETLAVQSAQVNTIGGATDTSLAFKQSLASALAKAAHS